MRPPRLLIAAAAGALVAVPGFALASPGSLLDLAAADNTAVQEVDGDCDEVPDNGIPDCDADSPCDDVPDNGVPTCVEADPAPDCDDDPTTEVPDCDEAPTCDEDPETTDVPDCEGGDETDDTETDEADDEADDEGHGEAISALAQCMPSGRTLHGVGFNKGFVMSQAASTGEVTLPDAQQSMTVASPEEAQAVCDAVDALIELEKTEAAETGGTEEPRAKGRPDWAGPKSDDDEVDDSDDTTTEATTDAAEVDEDDDADRGGPPAHAGKGKGKR